MDLLRQILKIINQNCWCLLGFLGSVVGKTMKKQSQRFEDVLCEGSLRLKHIRKTRINRQTACQNRMQDIVGIEIDEKKLFFFWQFAIDFGIGDFGNQNRVEACNELWYFFESEFLQSGLVSQRWHITHQIYCWLILKFKLSLQKLHIPVFIFYFCLGNKAIYHLS